MKKEIEHKYLIIGIGNYGRQDDGLGWEFLDMVIPNKPENVVCEYRFQLQIEDAELLRNFNTVIFIDASKNKLKNGFEWSICKSSQNYSFSTHALKPETILYLSENLYSHHLNAHILAIEGYDWELQNGLTKKAKKNLKKGYQFIMEEIFCTTKV